MDDIDITMTAVLRPKIIEQSLQSVVKNVVDNKRNFRLILNVDPVGEDINPTIIVDIGKKYFDDVVWNIPDKPWFPAAVKWVWSQTKNNFVFHIEDDWNIKKKLDIDHMIYILRKNKILSSLRLSVYDIPKEKIIELFGSVWIYKYDGYYQCFSWKRVFGLQPILIKKKFIKQAVELLRNDMNPEKQFRVDQPHMKDLIEKWRYGIYSKIGESSPIEDLGNKWKEDEGLEKGKSAFLTWEKTA